MNLNRRIICAMINNQHCKHQSGMSTTAIMMFFLVFWWISSSVSSFVITTTRRRSSIPFLMVDHQKRKNTLHHQTFLSSSSSIKATELDLDSSNSPTSSTTDKKQIELWLDLRGTAVHPKVAVDYISEELQQQEKIKTTETKPATIIEESSSSSPSSPSSSSSSTTISQNNNNNNNNKGSKLIDKVLLSDSHFQTLVESLDPYTQIEDVLYIPEQQQRVEEETTTTTSSSSSSVAKEKSSSISHTNTNLVALSRNGVSFPFGNLIGVPRDDVVIADPIEVIQDLSQGNWILFVSEDEKCESIQQLNAMGNFLEIASTASFSWSVTITELESGLLVHNQQQQQQQAAAEEEGEGDQQPSSSKSSSGGVAIKCSTRESVLQLASIFQTTLSASTKTTTTTESGILIQESPEEEEQGSANTALLPLAMILPFDLSLWEAASLIYGDDEDQYVMGE